MATNISCVFRNPKHFFTSLVLFPAVVHYIGPGRRGRGDWCFCDGYISFRDIADLYTQHFTGKVLSIVLDCSYSGKWVEF